MAITPDKERLYIEVLKTEYMLLTGAALAAIETGRTDGLYEVVKMLNGAKALPAFQKHLDQIEARRAADKAKLDKLKTETAARKSTGPSPWGL